MRIKNMIIEHEIPFLVKNNGEVFPVVSSELHISEDGNEYAQVYTGGPVRYMLLDSFSVTKTANMPINKMILGDASNKVGW